MSTFPPQVPPITKQKIRDKYPGIDKKAIEIIEKWRDSVSSGTSVPVHKVYCFDGCGCTKEGWSTKCKGGPFVHLEILGDIIFPEDGSPCVVEGVHGAVVYGPLVEQALGHKHHIVKM